jgi:hypothetical protein
MVHIIWPNFLIIALLAVAATADRIENPGCICNGRLSMLRCAPNPPSFDVIRRKKVPLEEGRPSCTQGKISYRNGGEYKVCSVSRPQWSNIR